MFVNVTTKYGRYSINVNNVLFFYATKKGAAIEFVDGTTFEVEERYDDLCRIFSSQNMSNDI